MKQSILIIIITVLFPFVTEAQEGIIKYKQLLNLDTTQPGQYAPIIPAFLYFDSNKRSLYASNRLKDPKTFETGEEQLAKGALSINTEERDEYGNQVYKDFILNQAFLRQIVWNEGFISEEPLPVIQWNIWSDTRELGHYHCTKATTTFRGREYEAWFTTEIPINDGPWKLHGLPGLILEAYDKTREVQFLFESIDVPSPAEDDIKKPEKGIHIPFEEFKVIERTQSDRMIQSIKSSMERGTEVDIKIDVYPIEKNYDDEKKRKGG